MEDKLNPRVPPYAISLYKASRQGLFWLRNDGGTCIHFSIVSGLEL
jgi:hypothetical protein